MKLSQFSGMLLIEANGQAIHMDAEEQKELVRWACNNRLDIIEDIICRECGLRDD